MHPGIPTARVREEIMHPGIPTPREEIMQVGIPTAREEIMGLGKRIMIGHRVAKAHITPEKISSEHMTLRRLRDARECR